MNLVNTSIFDPVLGYITRTIHDPAKQSLWVEFTLPDSFLIDREAVLQYLHEPRLQFGSGYNRILSGYIFDKTLIDFIINRPISVSFSLGTDWQNVTFTTPD